MPTDAAASVLAEPALVDLLRLTKLANSLLFLLTAVVDADHGDDSTSVRRRITGGLLIGGMTCETLKVASEVVKHERFAVYASALRRLIEHPLVADVNSKYLARARDKAAFHADKVVMREALPGLKVSTAILEHVSGWNTLNTYYPTADLLAYLYILGDDLPTDEEISAFHSSVHSRLRRLEPAENEGPFDNAIRRAVEVTVQVSSALSDAISQLTVQVHKEIGGQVVAGPPRSAAQRAADAPGA